MNRLLPLFALLTAIATGASGCGASNAIDPVAKAADVTEAAGTAQMRMTGTVSGPGVTLPMTGGGAIDNKTKSGHITMHMTLPKVGKTYMEEILKWPTIYMRSPLFAHQLPHGATWMKIDLAKAGKQAGINMGALQDSTGGGGDTTSMLRWLKGSGHSKKVGTETVDGTSTTHYRSTIDLAQAVKRSNDPEAKQSLARLQKITHVKSMPAEVWVDRSGRVRRQRMGWSQVLQPGSAQRVRMQFTIDFVKFGVPADVQAPAADQVFDATTMASKGLSGQTTSG